MFINIRDNLCTLQEFFFININLHISTNNSNNTETFKIIILKKRLIQKQHTPSRSSAAETRLYERSQHPWRVTFIVNNPRVRTRVSERKTLLGGKRLPFADS